MAEEQGKPGASAFLQNAPGDRSGLLKANDPANGAEPAGRAERRPNQAPETGTQTAQNAIPVYRMTDRGKSSIVPAESRKRPSMPE